MKLPVSLNLSAARQLPRKKLEDEQANLVRVSDILSELEKQVGPLERQSRGGQGISSVKGQP